MKQSILPELTITFEQLYKRVGFGLAVCICDKELDEKFWSSLDEEHRTWLLGLALSNEVCPRWMNAPVRGNVGSVVITRYAKEFCDWLTAYKQISQLGKKDKRLRNIAVKKLRELAVTFDEWNSLLSCGELRKLAGSNIDRLATTREEHLIVLMAHRGLTMKKVEETIESEKLKAGRDLARWEICNIIKEVELVTDLEKRHWEAAFAIRERFDERTPAWNEIWKVMWVCSNHPIACKALRESEAQVRNSR